MIFCTVRRFGYQLEDKTPKDAVQIHADSTRRKNIINHSDRDTNTQKKKLKNSDIVPLLQDGGQSVMWFKRFPVVVLKGGGKKELTLNRACLHDLNLTHVYRRQMGPSPSPDLSSFPKLTLTHEHTHTYTRARA